MPGTFVWNGLCTVSLFFLPLQIDFGSDDDDDDDGDDDDDDDVVDVDKDVYDADGLSWPHKSHKSSLLIKV